MGSGLCLISTVLMLSQLHGMNAQFAPAFARAPIAAPAPAPSGSAADKDTFHKTGLGKDLNLAYLMPAQAPTTTPVKDNSSCNAPKECPGGWVEQADVTYGDNPRQSIHFCICRNASFTLQSLVQEYSTVSRGASVRRITAGHKA